MSEPPPTPPSGWGGPAPGSIYPGGAAAPAYPGANATQTSGLAIASLVLGVFSLVELGALVVPGIASILLGVMALVQLRRSDMPRPRGHGL